MAVGAGWPELAAPSTAVGGPDLLAAVLSIGLAAVGAVTVVCALVLRAERRRANETKRGMDEEPMGAIEIVNRRARSRAQIRIADDPIVAGMELDPPHQHTEPQR
ncbi:MAG: hypothetical protein M3R49_04670 [Chloroflexota bacterium]|nr:hypothetical protein [Chloroflexota bacterium]